VETGNILKFTTGGIEMENGTNHKVDAIICATGFDTSFRPPFPLIGYSGKDLREVWKDEPRSYLSLAAAGFPNYFGESFGVI
jgi:cation diffusion facilitator CzcD-associated flavoprotein CzcO